jgi:hypothetical protein
MLSNLDSKKIPYQVVPFAVVPFAVVPVEVVPLNDCSLQRSLTGLKAEEI